MQDNSNTPNASEGSSQPWRTEPPADSPWYSDSYLWQSLDDESVHHVPEGVITPEMLAETDRDARPFWWAHNAHAALALVEDVERDDHFRVVQADTLTKLVALLRHGVEWPDFVDRSEPLPSAQFEEVLEQTLRVLCAVDDAAFSLESHGFEDDPMGGRWAYRRGGQKARIAALPLLPNCWVRIDGAASTGELSRKSEARIHSEITALLQQ